MTQQTNADIYRIAGDCARAQDEQQAAPGDVVLSAETVQPPSLPHTDAFDQAGATSCATDIL